MGERVYSCSILDLFDGKYDVRATCITPQRRQQHVTMVGLNFEPDLKRNVALVAHKGLLGKSYHIEKLAVQKCFQTLRLRRSRMTCFVILAARLSSILGHPSVSARCRGR